MKTNKYAILLITLTLLLVLIPTTAWASSRYAPDAEGTLYVEVLDAAGDPVNDATVVLDLMDSDGNLELDGVSMDYIAGSDGIYKYDFTAPSDEGTYIAVATCAEGQSTTEVQVVSPSGSAGDVWGEDMTTYTDVGTFGGVINNITEGGQLPMFVICAILALGLLAIFFWKNTGIAAYGASGLWLLLGFVAMGQSSSPVFPIQDTYMGLFWMGVIFCMACALLPAVMREKPSKDDIYVDEVDEVTGEPKEKDESNPRRRRGRTSSFGSKGAL